MTELDKRLTACAALVHGEIVGDVGTDHAYIPIALIENGRCRRAIASDINEGPVERARRNVTARGLSDRIAVIRADGIDDNRFADCDSIVIAGMGGELICRIIEQSDHAKTGIRLILQPMTKAECVRAYLWDHGFRITDDVVVCEGKRIYQIIAAQWCGQNTSYTAAQALVGMPRDDAEYAALIRSMTGKIAARIAGKRCSGTDTAEEEQLISELTDLL